MTLKVIAVGALSLALLIIVVILVWKMPEIVAGERLGRLSDAEQLKALNDARVPIVASIAGVGAGVGAIYAARTYSLNKVSAHADRYAKAVEQLASEKLEVRVGGVYALESVAKVLSRDTSPVADVLSAFVRAASVRDSGDSDSDIHAAVNVLSRGLLARQSVDLTKGRFVEIRLSGNTFAGANIAEGDFSMSRLVKVSFKSANLHLVDFTGANLEKVSFAEADLSGADFRGAVVKDCSFKNANMEECRGLGA